MKTKILALNVGVPETMEWNGQKVVSSMRKSTVDGPLVVSMTNVEGDVFQSTSHGTPDSVLYAYGLASANEVVKRLGRSTYEPGALGENLTLEAFDEEIVSVGDTFRIGEVLAQATFPRIPCVKVNIRMCHSEGQKAMHATARSGVYFRILEPGIVRKSDQVELITKSEVPLSIADVYRFVVAGGRWPNEAREKALANGKLPAKWMSRLASESGR